MVVGGFRSFYVLVLILWVELTEADPLQSYSLDLLGDGFCSYLSVLLIVGEGLSQKMQRILYRHLFWKTASLCLMVVIFQDFAL